ncbi:putative extracellular solute-binding protein [Phaeobacter inhibens]|uniref:ABC transporter substrate-binding protein n=1 Tax=Phaeobacter inhibens TaxID=221822 RepID=UPI000C9D1BC1|nr:ABC transporter substrate-binding protein [Phaeobacter inhibens]AUR02659.1 putative extracellular solute-binding protein [Phaeobacter inhibens]
MKLKSLLLTSVFYAGAVCSAEAETLKWARAGDALTLDPHAQNEGPTITLGRQIMEPLVDRDMKGGLVPGLSTEWRPSESDPNVWTFTLRDGVKFHDGADFDSEDVVFSINRAMTEKSNYREVLASVAEVRATGPYRVEIVTKGPNSIMPNNLTNLLIMDKGWAEANDAVDVQDYEGGESTYAAKNANGTGPYKVVSREPDVKTVLERFDGYWGLGQFPLQVTRIEASPIQNPATRVAALLSGEVDFIQDVPVQDLSRVDGSEGLDVRKAPQNRVIFFGMNQGDADLANDNVDGKNPLSDVRVRQAMNMAINREAIQKIVMRGQSEPAGVALPPFVNGWTAELDKVPATDIAAAKALMEEAGYGDGFSIKLDCPNDRYINDEAICQASVGMFAQIGINVNLDAKPKAQHFPLINNLESDFYMLGWGVPTYDSEYIFNFLVHSKGEAYGSWNSTRYSNAELDKAIEALASETNIAARNESIGAIWDQVQEDVLYLPIHHQVLNWGMKSHVDAIVDPEDSPKFKYFAFK